MASFQIFSDVQWLFPDTPISAAGNPAVLHVPRNADADFQVLTDLALQGGEVFACTSDGIPARVTVTQLLPAHISENSATSKYTTTDYESVKHLVIRRAPYDIYDVTMPLDSNALRPGRAAFHVRLDVPADALPGSYSGSIALQIGNEALVLPVDLTVYRAQIPPLSDSAFHMTNWLYYPLLAEQYGVAPYSDAYMQILRACFENQIDMRNDYMMLPFAEPVRDDAGKVVDFDFTAAEIVGNLALEYGFKYILGRFVARWVQWDDPDNALLWDRSVTCCSIEGFRQLKLYFRRAWECVVRNNWQEQYMQCLVDEPQFHNSLAYRALSAICRQNMPGVKIHDPVETTEIAGALDVWAVKQAIYEQYIDDYQTLQAIGEELWLYTCGFPAGHTMNRVLDLPLTASRLPMWLCYRYNCPGFLHWGYHACPPGSEWQDGCTPTGNLKYPPGNAHIVYSGDQRPWYSLRGHAQRTGAMDYELLHQLGQRDPKKARELVDRVCRSFDDYTASAEVFDQVRKELLEALDA